MKYVIKHEIRGRIRLHVFQQRMSLREADLLQYYLCSLPGVSDAKVYERTADAVVYYQGSRCEVIEGIRRFSYQDETLQELVPQKDRKSVV